MAAVLYRSGEEKGTAAVLYRSGEEKGIAVVLYRFWVRRAVVLYVSGEEESCSVVQEKGIVISHSVVGGDSPCVIMGGAI